MAETASYKIIKFKAKDLPKAYRPMIFAKFLRSLRRGNTFFKLIEPQAYYQVYHAYLETLLSRDSVTVKLAVLSDDHDTVIAWAIQEPEKLHYVWVNKDIHKTGVASSLIDPFKTFTHLTDIALEIWNSKYPSAKFNPFA